MRTTEFRRWLAQHGATFKEGARHTKIYMPSGQQSTLPRHPELNEKLRLAILKQLGLK